MITVRLRTETIKFPEAHSWEVDPDGGLNLYDGERHPIAEFAPSVWEFVVGDVVMGVK